MNKLKSIFKDYRREIILFLLAFLISTISFGLGYLMAGESNRAPIMIEKCSAE